MFRRLWQQLAIATNWPVLAAVAVLSCLGCISIYADSRPDSQKQSISMSVDNGSKVSSADSRSDGQKQLLYLCVAAGCLIAFQAVNYQVLGRWGWPFYLGSLLLVLYTVVGGIAGEHHHPLPFVHNTKGVYAWINFGSISLEPSELVKVSFIMVTARYLRFRSTYRTVSGLLPPFALALVPTLLILKQPDLGVAALFIPTLLAMLFVAGAKVRHMFGIVAIGLLFAPVFYMAGDPAVPGFRHLPSLMRDYQRQRVQAMFSSSPALAQKNYQQDHALMAMGSGGLGGKGIGEVALGRRVPESHNDMVFAVIGEQFGFVGSVAVLGAYLVLFAAGIEISAATKEPFGRLVAVGVVAMMACQAFLNLAVAMKLFPVTGVTLPFVSYGGSSLVASFLAAGLLLNVGQNRPLVLSRDGFSFD